MIDIIEEITIKVKEESEKHLKKTGYDFYNDHIKYVVKNGKYLANNYVADMEVVILSALLHDIAMVMDFGPRKEHHIYGAKKAEEILSKYNYPEDKIELIKKCILNHRGSTKSERSSIEEICIADADALAHFDAIPSLFSLSYKTMGLTIEEGAKNVKRKLEGDFNKLSTNTKEEYKEKYDNIMKLLFRNY